MSKKEQTLTVTLTRKEVAWLSVGMILRYDIDMDTVPGTIQENYETYLSTKEMLENNDVKVTYK